MLRAKNDKETRETKIREENIMDSDIICEEKWFFRGYNDSATSGEYIQANDRWTYIIE